MIILQKISVSNKMDKEVTGFRYDNHKYMVVERNKSKKLQGQYNLH